MKGFSKTVQSGEFAVTAELALTSESGAADIAAQVAMFDGRVNAMQVADNPLAWVHMSPLAASAILLREGMDAVPILTCRDRNRIGLYSDLLGLRSLGVSTVLLGRGRRVGKKHALHASTVFDMTGRELIAMAAALNTEAGAEQGHLLIGTGAKAHRARQGWAAEGLVHRADAGAEFVQTQFCLNMDLLKHWMEALVQAQVTWRYSIIVSLGVLSSPDMAHWMKKNMPDSKIPQTVIDRLESAADPESEGVAICAETIRAIKEIPGISGIHLMSTGQPELLSAALDAAELKSA